jgi:poly(hydroxyalkanoate) granule-associated protein
MAARKTTTKPAAHDVADFEAKPAKKAEKAGIKAQITNAIEQSREESRERMLAGLGLIARARQQREERMAELVEEGKRFEPKVKQAIEDLKTKLQPKDGVKFDLKKLKLDGKAFDREAMKSRFEERMTEALHRLGLPTRKEVDALSKKVEKLAELQRA